MSQTLLGGLLTSPLNPQIIYKVNSIINSVLRVQNVKMLNNLPKVTQPFEMELGSESSKSDLRCGFNKLRFSEVV